MAKDNRIQFRLLDAALEVLHQRDLERGEPPNKAACQLLIEQLRLPLEVDQGFANLKDLIEARALESQQAIESLRRDLANVLTEVLLQTTKRPPDEVRDFVRRTFFERGHQA